MKTLMILGASRSQLPLIRAAKAMGVRTVCASAPGAWPGFDAADEAVLADISDPDAILAAAKRFGVDGITTCCMDTGLPALARACQALGLPGLSPACASTVRDKYLMKEAFVRYGVNTPRHFRVFDEEGLRQALAQLSFPVALKVTDLMGSRGVYQCKTRREAEEAFRQARKETQKPYCLVEEFLEGILFDGEGMIQNGSMVFSLLSNSDLFQARIPTSIGHSIPFRLESQAGDLARAQMEKAAKAVGLDQAAFDCDLMLAKGKVYVIELNGRAGACCLPDLVGFSFGINYYESLVRLALGQEVSSSFQKEPAREACQCHTLYSLQDGILEEIQNRVSPSPDILDLAFYVTPGQEIHGYQGGRDALGHVILQGSTLKACEKRLEEVLEGIEFRVNSCL